MFKKLIEKNIEFVTRRPKLVLAVSGIVTIIALILASGLQMELNWVALAPKDDKAVQEYQEILENFPTLDNMLLIIESDNQELMEKVAIDAREQLMAREEYVKNVTIGVDRDFMLEYSLLYMEPEDIEMMGGMLYDANLYSYYPMMSYMIETLTKEYDDGNLSAKEYVSQLKMTTETDKVLDLLMEAAQGQSISDEDIEEHIVQLLTGSTLLTSENGQMAMVSVMPAFDIMDIEKLEPGVAFVEEVVEDLNTKYEGVTVNVTGMHVVARDETASIMSDSQLTTVLSLILILILLYIAFRSILAPVLAFIPLLFGIIWSMGISAVVIGRLNMMTAFSAAMLIGLGIDYAIHMYSSYTEKRANGFLKEDAIRMAIEISGPGIITGALTTAVAFLALNISQLELLSELGTIMGTGILTTLFAVFWILPALIVLKKEKASSIGKLKGEIKVIGSIAEYVASRRVVFAIILLFLTIFMAIQVPGIRFDMNMLNLEPEGLKSVEVMEYLVDEYEISSDSFNIQVDSLEEVYRLTTALEAIEGVYDVTSVADVLPEERVIKERLESVRLLQEMAYLRAPKIELTEETFEGYRVGLATSLAVMKDVLEVSLSRLELIEDSGNLKQDINRLIDMSDESIRLIESANLEVFVDFVNRYYDVYYQLAERMIDVETLTLSDLPEAFKSHFVSKNEDKFMINVIPAFDVWSNLDTEKGIRFFEEIRAVDESVTGTPIFMKVLFDSVADELVLTGSVLFGILILILLIHFKSIKLALLALLPLTFTLVFMIGTMVLIDLPFNMLNFLSILLVIGIGIDDGVHILHHYRKEEKSIRVLYGSVGKAISLTTLTTAFGFGSLMFSSYRGIATLGKALCIGVIFALVLTVFILPLFLKEKHVE